MTKLVSSLTMAGVAMLAIAVSGCGTKTAAPADSASIEATIKADEKNWMDQFKNRDLEALAGHYADDAVFVSSAGPAANGSTEIRRFFANGLTDKNFTVTFASDKIDVAASGDLAYSRGHYTLTMTNPATKKPEMTTGYYLTVWQKQSDGSWKAVEDFTAPGAPQVAQRATALP
jgi:uncharacterized protein (TIGR02246 family)